MPFSDPEKQRAAARDGQYRRSQVRRRLLNDLKSRACADCGVTYPPYVMQFDHLDPKTKIKSVNQLRSHSLEKLMAEIAKCELVCANCHAERSQQRIMVV